MQFKRQSASLNVVSLGNQRTGRTRGVVTAHLSSLHDFSASFSAAAFILRALTTPLPSFTSTGRKSWSHLNGLQLADPDFLQPRPVDLIIGADSYGKLIESEVIKGRPSEPIAQRTLFGWIVLGPISDTTTTPTSLHHASVEDDVSLQLRKFWEVEELPSDSAPTQDEDTEFCEQHFKSTHTRDASGRYTVRLPFKLPPTTLGDSFTAASRSLHRLRSRLSDNEYISQLYAEFLQEYEALHHMIPVPDVRPTKPCFILPHRGVVREHSVTTKLRVVFNGSCKTNTGFSLNDILHTGPKLQQDISDVLLWIRQHRFIFATDITKMYRQILLHPDDQDFQRILWYNSNNEQISYKLTTVTYGLSCAPYLAIRVMLQLVEDEGQEFPLAVPSLTKGRYVDDIFGGADSVSELRDIALQLEQICARGCLPLQKWTSNSPAALQHLDSSALQPEAVSIKSEDSTTKLLGLVWDPIKDVFRFNLQANFSSTITKRIALSETASLFDPLGFISPVIITAKIFMQELWLAKLQWDDLLPERLQLRWWQFRESLSDLPLISLPRWLHSSPTDSVELHGFSDASQLAMAAVVYLRSTSSDGSTSVTLLASKTRVAPLKRLSIPRLELSAALLLARLIAYIQKTLPRKDAPLYLWTDSSVTLTWVSSQPARWKDFVRNRVSLIQDLTSTAKWRFISGKENPADCASRGLTPLQLSKHSLWWSGPTWLMNTSENWPAQPLNLPTDAPLEHRPGFSFTSNLEPIGEIWDLVQRYSSLTRLLRITAMCQRALHRFKRSSPVRTDIQLTPDDLEQARLFWVLHIQSAHFAAELRSISNGNFLTRGHFLSALTPFIDSHGTLRVGGRLQHSSLNLEAKHPAILPRHSTFTTLVIADAHLKTLHGGTQSTLTLLRSNYWIVGGRAPIRSFILHCAKCVRFRGLRAQQLMGQLPISRATPSRAFLHTGLDYAGPFTVKTWRGRNTKTYKGYLAVFVCFSTSAVHLELVTDYTSDAFIAAFRRFTSRRGICHTLYSDCGTNFIGADAQLQGLFKESAAEMPHIISSLTNIGTRWSFNPPSAPHMGGKWEAAVKSAKHHLQRVIGDSALTYEEFTTLLTQVESVLNSRPLGAMSDDPDDFSALTPGHFLIGEALNSVPEPSLTSTPELKLPRWAQIQRRFQQIWQRWSSDYLQHGLATSKWRHPRNEIQVGSLVLITDERLPPSKWPLARVVSLHPGEDELTRVVTLRTESSTFKRPISKLCILPVTSSTTSVAEGGECVQKRA
ncbi:uncharacterized protein [Venturia canescens]|uniref:uncharacterized protein n=1 Tax=Venturia canescens TaxID=32260 RepID=UPI001C9C9C5E|nr:uncharacterized protein LOC122406317 [Venturia canescens]